MAAWMRRWQAKFNIGLMIALIGVMFGLAGCKAQQARNKLKSANQKLAEAEAVNAEKYAPDLMKQIREQIAAANTSLAGGQADEGLTAAKRALELAGQAVQQSKNQFATDQSNEATAKMDIAKLNQLQVSDAQRFEKVQKIYDQLNEAKAKGDNDAVIRLATQVVNETDLLLKTLRNEADLKLTEAQTALTKLKGQGAQNYVADMVIEVTDMVKNVERLIKEKNDYINARTLANSAIARADDAIEATNREKCKEAITQIEVLITVAMDEGAVDYQKDQLLEVNKLYDTLMADFEEKRYEKVLLAADVLKPKVQQLVFSTKKKASEKRIEHLASTIGQLQEAGVEEYLPGRLDLLQQMLGQAREAFQGNTEKDFDRIKLLSQDAVVEEEKVRSAFNDLAEEEHRKTRDELDKTMAVFNKMQGIFIIQPRAGMAPLDAQFENAKETLRQELAASLKNAELNLEVARDRRQAGKYKGSIVLAQEVGRQVAAILDEIYHVVGFNAVMELSSQITSYELNGAREYAALELARTKGLLEDTKNLIASKQYREAVTRAAETRAQMELMVQRVAERASNAIQEARATAETARSAVTERYKRDDLNAAIQLIDSADKALAANQLKASVEMALQATEKARTAAKEAHRLAAEDELENARSLIKRALDAGANLYAGKEFDDSKRLVQSSEKHFTQEDYEISREVAIAASDMARKAFYKLLDEADAAINEAKSAGGWELNRQALVRAIAKNDEARRLIELASYKESASLARGAGNEALSIAKSSKLSNYGTLVGRIRMNLEEGRRQGLTLFQAEEAVGINQQLVFLEDNFDRSGLSNYEFTMNELTKLEANLRNTLDGTEQRVTRLIAEQNAELDALADRGAAEYAGQLLASARDNLKFAQLDFGRKLYKSAHTSIQQALSEIREVKRREAQENYVAEVRGMFERMNLARSRFSSVLNLEPVTLKKLAQGDRGKGRKVDVSGAYSSGDFRKEVEELYSLALSMNVPSDQAKTHQEVIAALNDARLGALSFEKMAIFDEFSQREVESIIDQAYKLMASSSSRVSNLLRQFSADEKFFREATASSGLLAQR